MPRSHLPQVVRLFIERYIDEVEQLEVLLALCRDAERFWSASAAAEVHCLPRPHAAAILERLARYGLFDVRIASDVMYRFSPASPALALEVEQLVQAYTTHRGELLALIHSPRRRSLKDFSDAFRLTRDDNG
jgi:hypothetical protein